MSLDVRPHLGREHSCVETLLPRLPPAARKMLRHYEVAAVVETFEPRPPLKGGLFARNCMRWHAGVTRTWSSSS